MNKPLLYFIALVTVYILLSKSELYKGVYTLDTEWTNTRNDFKRTADPFNTCSPESFDDCKKVKMPHLSRA
jgi:hypothetical protein